MNAKSGISTQKLSKKVMSYSRLIQTVFFVDLCYEHKIIHKCRDMTVASPMSIVNTSTNSFSFSESLLLGRKCVQFE